jgi:hypothetical protein
LQGIYESFMLRIIAVYVRIKKRSRQVIFCTNCFLEINCQQITLYMKKRHWLYENNEDNTVRYILGTKGKKPLLCFGINPSTAEPEKLDNTLKSVERVAPLKRVRLF